MIRRVLRYEWAALRRSLIPHVTALFVVGGVVLGRSGVWLEAVLHAAGLGGYVTSGELAATQISVPLALLAYVIAAGYVFGRDSDDGSFDILLTAPVRREAILTARFSILGAWVTALTLLAIGSDFLMRWVLSFTAFDPGPPIVALGVFASTASAYCVLPLVAWIALRFRSVWSAIGVGIGLHVAALVPAAWGVGTLLPWNAPWGLAAGEWNVEWLVGGGIVFFAGLAATVWEMRTLDTV